MMRDEVNSDTQQNTVIDAPLHVLGFRDEDGLWWARALEVDLLGHGDTFAEALQCLKGVLQAHFEYVHVEGMEDALPHRAETKYWRMFYNASKPRIMMQGEKIKEPTYHAVAIPQPTIDPKEEFDNTRGEGSHRTIRHPDFKKPYTIPCPHGDESVIGKEYLEDIRKRFNLPDDLL